jgi:hypothetical protein
LCNSLTNAELEATILKKQEELEKKKKKLELLKSTDLISDEDLKKIDENLEKYLKELKKRKRIAKEMLNQVADGRDMKPSDLFIELELEEDGVDLESIGKL